MMTNNEKKIILSMIKMFAKQAVLFDTVYKLMPEGSDRDEFVNKETEFVKELDGTMKLIKTEWAPNEEN